MHRDSEDEEGNIRRVRRKYLPQFLLFSFINKVYEKQKILASHLTNSKCDKLTRGKFTLHYIILNVFI